MTTPAGYYDEAGNFIPGSFADSLDMPGPQSPDSAAAMALQQQVTAAKGAAEASSKASTTASANARAIQAKLKKKGLNWATKASLNAQLKEQQAIAAKQLGINKSTTAQVSTLQNKYYEVSGQYEKLLTGQNRDAYAALSSMFNQYGLGSLAGKIYEYAKQGYGADVISLLLQNTSEYKERFAGNAARTRAGLPVLSPAEYLQTESAYRQVLQNAGLPKGFYDSPTDFQNWIAGDVSPTEIKGRVDLAVANTSQANPYTKQALQDLYGVDQSHLIAYYLDNKKALPLLQKQAQAAQFGAEALKRNLTLNLNDLEDYVTAGLSLSQVSQGYQAVAEALPNIQAIAARYGETFNQHELEKDLIEGNVNSGTELATGLYEGPTNKRKRLASQERALFGGYGGGTPGGLSAGFQAT